MSTLVCDIRPPAVARPRDGLRLSLNRSLSEPGPSDVGISTCSSSSSSSSAPLTSSCSLLRLSSARVAKHCKLECISLPPSPCSDSATFQKSLILKKVRELDADAFRHKLGSVCKPTEAGVDANPFLIIDCRSFIAYNLNHIRGSINVNCADRFNRKRLYQGKATLADLTATKEAKNLLKKRCYRDVIVYDEATSNLQKLTSSHPLFLIFTSLIEDNRQPILLVGGHKEFYRKHKEFCENTLLPVASGILTDHSANPVTCSADGATVHASVVNDARVHCSDVAQVSNNSGERGCQQRVNRLGQLNTFDLDSHPASRILPYLYLGNASDAADSDSLQRLGINRVLNVTSQIPGYHEQSGIVYKQIPANDSGHQNLKQYFEQAFDFIEEARMKNDTVLVHCQAGISRSPTIVIAYIMKYRRLTMLEAYKLVKNARSIISPNLNFMGQLLELEQGLMSTRMLEYSSNVLPPATSVNVVINSDCKCCRWSMQASDDVSDISPSYSI